MERLALAYSQGPEAGWVQRMAYSVDRIDRTPLRSQDLPLGSARCSFKLKMPGDIPFEVSQPSVLHPCVLRLHHDPS